MEKQQSAEEIAQQRIRVMGPDLGAVYHALCNEVTWLHAKWLQYRKLFGHSESRVDLLNQTAAFFFRVVQDVVFEDVLLHIARLTDPPRQGEYENLSLLRLPRVEHDQSIAADLSRLIATAKSKSVFSREWRNRRIAHRDYALALDAKSQPLPGVSRQEVEDVLAAFRNVLNHLESHHFAGHIAFECFLSYDDADALVECLERSTHATLE